MEIYYQRGIIFKIMSEMNPATESDLMEYIAEIRKDYAKDTFFWTYSKGAIITDDTVCGISSDIRDQLILLSSWIFNKGYRLKGEFYLRLPDSIECISTDGISKLVKFYVLIDQTANLSNKESDIIIESRNKMEKYMNKKNDYVLLDSSEEEFKGSRILDPGTIPDVSYSGSEELDQHFDAYDIETNYFYGTFYAPTIEKAIRMIMKDHFMEKNITRNVSLQLISDKTIYRYTIMANKSIEITSDEVECEISDDSSESSSDDFDIDNVTNSPPRVSKNQFINNRLDKIEESIEISNIMSSIMIIFAAIICGWLGYVNFLGK